MELNALKLSYPGAFQTRFGRRIALLFVVSALVPVGALSVESYLQVRSQLVAQATTQLEQTAKNVGMGVLDQLTAAEGTLKETAAELNYGDTPHRGGATTSRLARQTFVSFAIIDSAGRQHAHWGERPRTNLSPAELKSLKSVGHVLRVAGTGPQIWIVTPLDGGGQMWSAVERSYLFRGVTDRARIGRSEVHVCVRDLATATPLLCSGRASSAGDLSAGWNMFLGYLFGAKAWRVELSQPIDDVLAPIAVFRRTFVLSVALILGLVVLLSSVHVRRSLRPLAALSEGTQRLARGDFSGTVAVRSGDEFEELADSFNQMSREMDLHFRVMTAVNAIDQAALTARGAGDVAAAAAGKMGDALRGATVDVLLAGEKRNRPWYRVRAANGTVRAESQVQLNAAELEHLKRAHGHWLQLSGGGFRWLRPYREGCVTLFPLVSHDELVGAVAMSGDVPIPEERLRLARQLADQLTVALSNAGLIVRLNGLSYGALSALARTVDASSPWTAGHSERVTALSLRIANRLGLTSGDVDTLYRGGLLHDIGKIGVPTYILDLAGPLAPDDIALMRKHPGLGAQILAPIAAFADAIPIVLHHHERLDGKGYPFGLKGDAIPYLARLLTVADVYDALVSDRPYRPGWAIPRAIERITADVGAGFDPGMVEAFLAVMTDEGDGARFADPPLELAGAAS